MKKGVVLVVAVCLSLVVCTVCSCTGKTTKTGDIDSTFIDSLNADSMDMVLGGNMPMPAAADELFDDFVFNFAANSHLQRQRIAFPLPVVTGGKKQLVSLRQWKTERFFMEQDYYTIIFNSQKDMEAMKDTTVNRAIIEKIDLDKGLVRQYQFDRSTGKWMMRGISEVPLSQSVHASFLEFYKHFSTDEDFQVKSMSQKVEFTAPDPDDDFNTMTGAIFPEQWPAFKPSLIPSGLIYNVEYGKISPDSQTKIFMVRGIANGYETEMTFHKTGNSWKLVKFAT